MLAATEFASIISINCILLWSPYFTFFRIIPLTSLNKVTQYFMKNHINKTHVKEVYTKKPHKWIQAHTQTVHQTDKYKFAQIHTQLNMFNCSNKATGQFLLLTGEVWGNGRRQRRENRFVQTICAAVPIHLFMYYVGFISLIYHLFS